MTDLKKTLDDLKLLNALCHGTVLDDAIELLKDKQPIKAELEGGGHTWWYVCGDCHGTIGNRDSYCRHCGRMVSWDV